MKILLMTNTYRPYTGGVQRSIDAFTEKFEQKGHDVLIIAPRSDDDSQEDDEGVYRVSAIKNFNDTNFPVSIPLPGAITAKLEEFQPEIVHSHFPFIIGSTAMRVAASFDIPLVFTYHTMYEKYIHYISSDSDRVREFVKKLTTGYSNLCNLVIAPSLAVKDILIRRGVEVPIKVIPTGIDNKFFLKSELNQVREKFDLDKECFVVGHVGRLASEKNLDYLTKSVSLFLKKNRDSRFMIVGDGPLAESMKNFFLNQNLSSQVLFTGVLKGQELIEAYQAMDLFVFASKTETQGMVLAEAMASSLPVIAIKATGVTDILKDGCNGYMLDKEDVEEFADKIDKCMHMDRLDWTRIKENAVETARHFSMDKCASDVLKSYEELIAIHDPGAGRSDESVFHGVMSMVKAEWEIFCNYANAAGTLISNDKTEPE
ncbi:MAG: glycosyltransferase [Sedimentisphaeraceae bacterium JB056]